MRFLIFLCLLVGAAQFPVADLLSSPAYAAGGSKKEEDPNAPKPEFEYLDMDPLILPIITDKGLTQQVSLKISLEIAYGTKEAIDYFKPRLSDAYLQDLYGALGSGHGLMQGNVLDVMGIKKRLVGVTERVLGEEHKVHDVLLQVVQQRPM